MIPSPGDGAGPAKSAWGVLLAIAAAAFVLRAAAGLYWGETNYWDLGYFGYLQTAQNFMAGHGLCLPMARFAPRNGCVTPSPLYSLLVAAALALSKTGYPLLVFMEALAGAATCVCTFFIGRQLFGEKTGLLAAGFAALYPYDAWRDVRLEETSLFTFLVTLSTVLLFRVPFGRYAWGLAAGIGFGLAALTRMTILPYAVAGVLWVGFYAPRANGKRFTKMAAVAVPLFLLVGGWGVRNYLVLGYPTVHSEIGRYLWSANNPDTFSQFPIDSMEKSENVAWEHLTAEDSLLIEELSPRERNLWFRRKAAAFVEMNPLRSGEGALRKLGLRFQCC